MGNPEARSSAKQALSRVVAVERQLREAAKQKSPLDSSLRQLRSKLQEEYSTVLFTDYDLAKSKDVEGLLWKAVFYKPIEEFRRRVKKARDGGSGAAEILQKTTKAFQSFLQDAMVFYRQLIIRLQDAYGDIGVSLPPLPGVPEQPVQPLGGPGAQNGAAGGGKDVSPSVARCLLFLGDLTRYSIMYSGGPDMSNKSKDWEPCAKYYSQAARVDPSSGQPHNQLAVLSTYSEDELGAVYHYAKALSAASPFLTARENLVLLFEKSRQRAALLMQDGAPSGAPQPRGSSGRGNSRGASGRGGGGRGRGQKPQAAKAKDPAEVATRYVRLAGILFTKTSLETLPTLAAGAAADLESVLQEAVRRARGGKGQQQQGVLGKRLQQLLVVLVFCVHNAQWVPEGHSLGYSEMVQRSVLLRSSLSVLFGFLARLASAPEVLLLSPAAQKSQGSGAPALLPLSLGVQWLSANPFKVPEDPDQAEVAARAEFLAAAAALLPGLRRAASAAAAAASPAGEAGPEGSELPLPEDEELRGFLPLVPAYSGLDWSNRGAKRPQQQQQLDNARGARVVAALGGMAPGAPEALSECEASLRVSSRGLLHTKEWRALTKATVDLKAAWSSPLPEPMDVSEEGGVEGGEGGAVAHGSAEEVDPMEEDPLEAQLEELDDEEEEEVILFQPMARPPSSSAGPGAPVSATKPAPAAPPAAPSAPAAPLAAPPAAPPAAAAPAPQYALPHMQGFQWGHAFPQRPPSSSPVVAPVAPSSKTPGSLGLGLGPAPHQQLPQSPDLMRSMGDSLMVNLGLNASEGEMRYAGTRMAAPPPTALPLAGGLLSSNGGSLFASSGPSAARPVAAPPGFGPPSAPITSSSSLAAAAPGGIGGGSVFGSGGFGNGGFPQPQSHQQSQQGSVSSALGEGYNWLDALEAQQSTHPGPSAARPNPPYQVPSPYSSGPYSGFAP